jgi:hypothetical protein
MLGLNILIFTNFGIPPSKNDDNLGDDLGVSVGVYSDLLETCLYLLNTRDSTIKLLTGDGYAASCGGLVER